MEIRADASKLMHSYSQKHSLQQQLDVMDFKIQQLEKRRVKAAEKTKKAQEEEKTAFKNMETVRNMVSDGDESDF